MEDQFKKKRDLLIFAGILLAYIFYLISVHIPMERHLIHVPLDDQIPFCELFVLPYIWWYGFISGPLIWFFLKSRQDFLDLGIYLLAGMWFCSAFFLIYPTYIDFQPQTLPRENLFSFLVELLYRADEPANVFPSIHCFESTAICIAIWKSKLWGRVSQTSHSRAGIGYFHLSVHHVHQTAFRSGCGCRRAFGADPLLSGL